LTQVFRASISLTRCSCLEMAGAFI
jgi:hypothetical protein